MLSLVGGDFGVNFTFVCDFRICFPRFGSVELKEIFSLGNTSSGGSAAGECPASARRVLLKNRFLASALSIYNRNLGPGGTDAVHFGPPATPIGGRASSRRPRSRHFGFQDPLFLSFASLSVSNSFLHLLEPSVAPKRSQLGSIWEPSLSFSGGFLGFVLAVSFKDNILAIFIDF